MKCQRPASKRYPKTKVSGISFYFLYCLYPGALLYLLCLEINMRAPYGLLDINPLLPAEDFIVS